MLNRSAKATYVAAPIIVQKRRHVKYFFGQRCNFVCVVLLAPKCKTDKCKSDPRRLYHVLVAVSSLFSSKAIKKFVKSFGDLRGVIATFRRILEEKSS